ncbi:DUF6151 family protein [Ideonella azotifigens]|uniref:CENP-V/GFA domain-containing protein n=1 Tax=Ideonella azotifigens TaxID=513160 RepID=A0ABP3URY2_9BURK|nr:DUF6151 family protein [Ideonella azotifigens]MCD2341919.1 DUF6151 family protein [Ideonella azotifigens]
MNPPHLLRCRCGTVSGLLSHGERANRCVCYCKDCQAFAHFLGEPQRVLDPLGGSEVIATSPAWLRFTQGREALACMSLTEGGMLRWYTRCCRTAIGNTPRNHKFSYIGLLHSCLQSDPTHTLAASFGPLRMQLNRQSARQTQGPVPSASALSTTWAMLRIARMVAGARIGGSYLHTPFFDVHSGTPLAQRQVLSSAEYARLQQRVGQS